MDLYLPSPQAASRTRKVTPTAASHHAVNHGLALEHASDSKPALGVQPCTPFFPSISKLWNLGSGGSNHGLSCPGDQTLSPYLWPHRPLQHSCLRPAAKGLSPGPVHASISHDQRETLYTGLDGCGVVCLKVKLCAVFLLGFAKLRKMGSWWHEPLARHSLGGMQMKPLAGLPGPALQPPLWQAGPVTPATVARTFRRPLLSGKSEAVLAPLGQMSSCGP